MEKRKNIAILVTRLILGGIFIMAGWQKFADVAVASSNLGLSTWLVYVVAAVELAGGIMIVLGAFTCAAAIVLAIVMLFAMYFSMGMGAAGVMMPLITFAGLVSLVGTCGGKYAVCCKCCKDCDSKGGTCAVNHTPSSTNPMNMAK